MIPEIRSGVLSVEAGYKDKDEDEETDEKGMKEVNFSQRLLLCPYEKSVTKCNP